MLYCSHCNLCPNCKSYVHDCYSSGGWSRIKCTIVSTADVLDSLYRLIFQFNQLPHGNKLAYPDLCSDALSWSPYPLQCAWKDKRDATLYDVQDIMINEKYFLFYLINRISLV